MQISQWLNSFHPFPYKQENNNNKQELKIKNNLIISRKRDESDFPQKITHKKNILLPLTYLDKEQLSPLEPRPGNARQQEVTRE